MISDLCVHHERAVGCHRFIEWLTAQYEHAGALGTLQPDRARLASLQDRQLTRLHRPRLCADPHVSFERKDERVEVARQRELRRAFLVEAQVEHGHRRVGSRRTLLAVQRACDEAGACRPERQPREVLVQQRLISRLRQLALRGQVDPELDHLHVAAFGRELLRVKLLVHEAAGCSHPLHVACADRSAATGRVAMLDLTSVREGHRLEPAMWVLTYSARLGCWLEVAPCGVIEQQERALNPGISLRCDHAAHSKAVADPVLRRGRKHAFDSARGRLSRRCSLCSHGHLSFAPEQFRSRGQAAESR